MCGVKISYKQIKNEGGPQTFPMEVQIDASTFKKPESVEMTDQEVLGLIEKTVTLNFPGSKIVTLDPKP
jgi:hypothetical protein